MTSDQNTITTRIGRTPFLYHLKVFAVLLPIVIVSAALITLVFAEQGESYRVFRAWFIVGMLAIFIFTDFCALHRLAHAQAAGIVGIDTGSMIPPTN